VSGELLGTLDYLAPEQISGARVDGRADVYSLACVLFECLTGLLPYVRENQAAVLWAHLHDEVPCASTVQPSLGPTVDAALARGMAKSPDDRFATARELVEALQTPFEAEATVNRDGGRTLPISSPPPATPTRRRGGLGLALAAVVGLLLGAAGAAAVVLLVTDDETAGPMTVTEQPPATTETTQSPRLAAMSEFDKALLQHVPNEFRASCEHARKLSDDFDATLSCRPGGAVSSLTYSHARSGFLLWEHFLAGMTRAGLANTDPPTLTGLCSAGAIPSTNTTVPAGLGGRVEVAAQVPRAERLGFVRCYERDGEPRIEWITIEPGIYSVATGEKLPALYDWWRSDAGPEP
jgi:hypothetical protein